MKKLLIAAFGTLLISSTALAMHCPSVYKKNKFDRVVMGVGKNGGVACLYNKDANPWLPPNEMYKLQGTFKTTAGVWSQTSTPYVITCTDGYKACQFKRIS